MRNKILSAAAAATIALVSTNAYAAANLTDVTIQGVGTSYSWGTSTTADNTIFLQQPLGNIFNPQSQTVNDPTATGLNSFTINGEGVPAGTILEASQFYLITLGFADGASISGTYNTALSSPAFVGTTDTVDGTSYTLTGFAWNRTRADNVSSKVAVAGGDQNDYAGQFSFEAVTGAVPEPTTWMMMLAGFGMVGAGLRSRSKVRTSVTYA